MATTYEELVSIFEKTDGRCHLCSRRLSFINYGAFGLRGAWERDHSVARALGGADTLRNKWPACISCNRSKQTRSSVSVRREYGLARRPLSAEKRAALRERRVVQGAVAGVLVGAMLDAGLVGALVGIAIASTYDD